MATELASAYVTLIPSLKGAQKQIESQLSGIDVSGSGRSMGSKLVSGIGSGFKTVAKIGIGAIGAVGTAVTGLAVGGGISRALKIDQAQFKFRALGMDTEAAMKSCSEAVSGTAFGLDAAATVATQFGASGVESGDAMTGALKAVAGVAAMSGSSMEDIGSIFSKVAAKGKVSGDELLQLNERGINGIAALSKHLGKSSDEVQKMVSKGEIDFATFSAAMQATFGEAAAGANETFQGASSNIMAALSRLGAKFASPALDSLRRVFVALIPVVDEIAKALEPAIGAFASFTDMIATRVVSGLEAFTATLTETGSVAEAIKKSIISMLDGTRLGNVITAFVEALEMGSGAASAFREALYYLFDGTALQPIADALVSPFKSWRERLDILMAGVGRILAGHIDFIKAKITELPQPVQNVIGVFGTLASSIAEKFSYISTSVWGAVGIFAGVLGKFSGPLSGTVTKIMGVGPAFASISSKIAGLGSAFMTAGGGLKGLTTLFGAFVSPVGIIVGIIAGLIAAFVVLMTTNEQFRNTVMSLVSTIGASLAPILAIVGQAVANLASTVLPMIMTMVQMLLPVIGQIIVVVLQVVAALAPIITMLISVLVPIITSIIELIVMAASQILALILPVISAVLSAIQTAMPLVQTIITAVMAVVLGIVARVWPLIQGYIETAMSIIQKVIETVWPIIESVINTVMGVIENIISIVTSAIAGDWEGVWNGIKNLFSDIWTGIQEAAQLGIDAVFEIVTGIKDSILGFFSGAGDWLIDAGGAILQGLWDGISGGLNWLGDQLAGIGDFIIEHKGPKAYDLKMLIPNGQWIMRSLSAGINAGIPALRKTLSGVSQEITDGKAIIEPFDAPAKTRISTDLNYRNAAMDHDSLSQITQEGIASAIADALIGMGVYVGEGNLVGAIGKRMSVELGRVDVREGR